jgi:hydrophobe/amphiphile efflux-3 (HAE3) family protein
MWSRVSRLSRKESRRRLLPLALALGAAALTFGAIALLGGLLTIATIAVLPILIGLAVDYAVQFQSRFAEEGEDPVQAAIRAAREGGPVIATAALATIVGFLALLLSPVPMMRSFGLALVLGIVLAFALALIVGFAVLGADLRLPSLFSRPRARYRRPRAAAGPVLLGLPALRRTGTRLPPRALRRAVGRTTGVVRRIPALAREGGVWLFETAIARPGRVLALATVLAVCGWVAGTRVETVSDFTKLVPGNQREIRDLRALQSETGTSGDINVVVRANDVTNPRVIRWMSDYQRRVLTRNGFKEGRPCREAQLCPALSLTNLFNTQATKPRQIRALLDALPRYFSQAVMTGDRKTANLAFGIRAMPLDEQRRLVDDLRAQLDPPKGVSVQLAGIAVLAADASADIESSRWLVTVAGLVAVLVVLAAVYRRPGRALVPLVPVLLATGWSGLVLFVSGVALNPMSATLGALIVAIATEFSVILSARYARERESVADAARALRSTFKRTGTAVVVSGITAIAGFAALVVSDVRMLRDFGLVTMIDLTVALAGVLIVLPAALVWVERRGTVGAGRRSATSAEAVGSEPA